MTNPRLLLTAFEPFGGKAVNNSLEILHTLERELSYKRHLEVDYLKLPVVVEKAGRAAEEALISTDYRYMLGIGEANANLVACERVAFNRRNFRIPDNEGNLASGEEIVPGGPASYEATLPYHHFVNGASVLEQEVVYSNDAGWFLCNELFYSVLYTIEVHSLRTKAGFLHVPEDATQVEPVSRIILSGIEAMLPTAPNPGGSP